MKTVIIENENPAVKRLSRLLSAVDRSIEIIAVLKSIPESLAWLGTHPAPDLIFMDIKLADGQNFKAFKSPVVFTTSYEAHTLCAFEVPHIHSSMIAEPALEPVWAEPNAAGVFSKDLALTSVNVFRLLACMQGPVTDRTYRRRFLVKAGTRLLHIETADIAYFYVNRRATFLKTFEGKKYIVDYTLEEVCGMLEPASFFRVNRACVVAAMSIQEIVLFSGNRLCLYLKPSFNKEVLVSREKVRAFKEWMGK